MLEIEGSRGLGASPTSEKRLDIYPDTARTECYWHRN